MRVGIHVDQYGRFCQFLEIYEKILHFNNIETLRLDVNLPGFWHTVRTVDLFIFRWQHHDHDRQLAAAVLPVVEKELGIKCLPDYNTCWHFDDKIKQYYLLLAHDFPVVESWIFWDKKPALDWIRQAQLPVVFKLKEGAGSSNVILVRTRQTAERLILRMFGPGISSGKIPARDRTSYRDFHLGKYVKRTGRKILRAVQGQDTSPFWQIRKNYVLFQRFLPGNDYDTRIIIIGDRAYGEKRLNRQGDFRASGGGRLFFDPAAIDREFLKIAFQISRTLKFQTMAYDFLYDEEHRPRICEISYTYPWDVFYYNCPGYWDGTLQWHEGHYTPQYFQLQDALGISDLKHPAL